MTVVILKDPPSSLLIRSLNKDCFQLRRLRLETSVRVALSELGDFRLWLRILVGLVPSTCVYQRGFERARHDTTQGLHRITLSTRTPHPETKPR